MEEKVNYDYSVIFTAIDSFKKDEGNKVLFEILNQSQLLAEQTELFEISQMNKNENETVSFTRA